MLADMARPEEEDDLTWATHEVSKVILDIKVALRIY
jgi:hypothetical protein